MLDSQSQSTSGSQDKRGSHDISADVMARCADLLANGKMDWPTDLSNDQQAELLESVRRHRRSRLIRFIASQIAADIAAEKGGRNLETEL